MKIFLGSSKERIAHMNKVARWISDEGHDALKWNDATTFPASSYMMKRLVELSHEVNAAVFIFGEDDEVWYREGLVSQPRDNVLIEYGIFTSSLGVENVMICRKGKATVASDAGGITWCGLDKPKRAQTEVKAWVNKLKPKHSNVLEKIRRDFSAITSQPERPFQSWLCEQHLESILKTLEPIKGPQAASHRGSGNYHVKVMSLLNAEHADTVLALCGRKFESDDENRKYFSQFYDFAKRKNNEEGTQGRIRVCRIFVQNKDGALDDYAQTQFDLHKQNRKNGVLGLIINENNRSHLEDFTSDGFLECIDRGFGFLVFRKNSATTKVIIHEGTGHGMAFVVLEDKMNIEKIGEIFKNLCSCSAEYHKAEKDKLDLLLANL